MCERRDDTPDSNSVSQRIVEARLVLLLSILVTFIRFPTITIPLLIEIFQIKDNIPLPFEILGFINCVEFAFNGANRQLVGCCD